LIESERPDSTYSPLYVHGEYLQKNPSWHVEDSPWKAAQILRAFALLSQPPQTICEIGCGAGEILRQLELQMPSASTTEFVGYDISPQAIALARSRESLRTKFVLGDAKSDERHFDALLCIDVFEHIEDYFSFLRTIRQKADYFVFHIPLELNCEGLLRNFLMDTRGLYGHLHQFTRETALAVLQECGYTVLGEFYTPGYECMPDNLHTRVTKRIRRMIFAALPRLSIRLINGLHLMVVAKG
jgi:cyclopropane fatty-acyl-phospholipid synthase-like methyltransferase